MFLFSSGTYLYTEGYESKGFTSRGILTLAQHLVAWKQEIEKPLKANKGSIRFLEKSETNVSNSKMLEIENKLSVG